MNYTTVIPTDLITPLGAYVRLRGEGKAAFLLESVERGPDRDRAELCRLVAGETAPELAEGRPHGGHDHGAGHARQPMRSRPRGMTKIAGHATLTA